jgi:hypothetical protein
MSNLNHFAISSILGSEIVGPFKAGHGQIGSLQDAQRYFDKRKASEPPSVIHDDEPVEMTEVKRVFLDLRNERGDRGSPDLYVADPERNAAFVMNCRAADLRASPYTLNKALLRARKYGYLPDLKSIRTSVKYEDFAFAVELAATEMKYRMAASIDDILCDPSLASEFDAIATKIAPGHTSFEYRWAILSIRKAGRMSKTLANIEVPELKEHFRLVEGALNAIPDSDGVYLLYENSRPLYAHGTPSLRHGIAMLQKPEAIAAIADNFWKPDFDSLIVNYATVPLKAHVRPVEHKIIEEKKPIFNVPRQAA